MAKLYQAENPNELLDSIIKLREIIETEGNKIYSNWEGQIQRKAFRESAENLSYYLALRNRDITQLQIDLIPWGLSSLGRLESKTLVTLDAVIATLYDVIDNEGNYEHPNPDEFDVGRRRLQKNTKKIFGKKPDNRTTRIMVTMPNEAINGKKYVQDLIKEGMNVARINCAHNTEEEWLKTINNIRANMAIIGCSGVNLTSGISTNNFHEAKINEYMINNTNGKIVLVADSTKIGKDTNFIVTDLQAIDYLITDTYADTNIINQIENLGIIVIQANLDSV